jgi:hypothetical protein
MDERDKAIWESNRDWFRTGPFSRTETKEEFIRKIREMEDEMASDRRTEEVCIAQWEQLQEQAKMRSLSEIEKRDVYYCELIFGGRERLLEYRRKKRQS